LGPLGCSVGKGGALLGSQIRGVEERAASSYGVEATNLGIPRVKMCQKGGFQAISQLPKEEAQVTRDPCMGCREADENQIKEAFINEGRGHSPSHLKFFLLVFSKLKEDIK